MTNLPEKELNATLISLALMDHKVLLQITTST